MESENFCQSDFLFLIFNAAIHEFPEDIFTKRQRAQGAVLLHIFGALYMFLALAIVCDDYFVTTLEKICEKLHMSEDVAGATFMAAGSSAPELFASIIGVFITHGDVGVGTIVGSAVFNILCIIGVCGIFAGQVVFLTKFSVFRDSICYILSVVALITVSVINLMSSGRHPIVFLLLCLCRWESLILIVMYVGYIIIMKFNTSIQNYFSGKEDKGVGNGNTVMSEMEHGNEYDSLWDDPSWPLLRPVYSVLAVELFLWCPAVICGMVEDFISLQYVYSSVSAVKPSKEYTRGSVVMVDEIINSSPPHYRFPEAGLRVMITNHFGPKTRLRMASRLIINEQQRLGKMANGVDAVLVADKKADTMENGSVVEDILTEEPESEMSSPFILPANFRRHIVFTCQASPTNKGAHFCSALLLCIAWGISDVFSCELCAVLPTQ
ncbi:hypothetical protein cypCar_00003637 [Cyprinus carpio]|nr:hypothetical protein cypCar_00003637 [Cyprinus carpio]